MLAYPAQTRVTNIVHWAFSCALNTYADGATTPCRMLDLRRRFMIYVCGLRGVVTAPVHVQPRHIISITDLGTPAPVVAGLLPECHLLQEFHDIGLPQKGAVARQQEHIEQILTFAPRWDGQYPFLV